MIDLSTLTQKSAWLMDGATGSNYFSKGLESGAAPELWNVERSETVCELHKEFLAAGSDMLLTNSFGGNSERLKLHGLEGDVQKLNAHAVKNAKTATEDAARPAWIVGSVGPTGSLIEPNGPLSLKDAVACFSEQIEALQQAGADLILLETMSSFEEAHAAILACKENDHMPYILTMSFDSPNNRTMMGISPENLVHFVAGMPHLPVALGANCGIGPRENLMTLLQLKQALQAQEKAEVQQIWLSGKPNRGIPQYKDGKVSYAGSEQTLKDYVMQAYGLGVKFIGGCCGTTPANLATMRKTLDEAMTKDIPPTTMETIVAHFGEEVGTTEKESSSAKTRRRRRRS